MKTDSLNDLLNLLQLKIGKSANGREGERTRELLKCFMDMPIIKFVVPIIQFVSSTVTSDDH